METILVSRKLVDIGAGSIQIPEPFFRGQRLRLDLPHRGPTGNLHKGNIVIGEIQDDIGLLATGRCPLRGCKLEVTVKATRPRTFTWR